MVPEGWSDDKILTENDRRAFKLIESMISQNFDHLVNKICLPHHFTIIENLETPTFNFEILKSNRETKQKLGYCRFL